MSDLLGLDQHNFEAGLNLLKKIRGPEPGIATAHDRDVRSSVGLKRRLCGVALAEGAVRSTEAAHDRDDYVDDEGLSVYGVALEATRRRRERWPRSA